MSTGSPDQRHELLKVALILVVVCGGTLVSVFSHREYWPFCTYPMFRGLGVQDTVEHRRLVGRTAGGLVVVLDREAFFGMIPSRLEGALRLVERSPVEDEEGLRWLHQLYEARRQAGEHHGPELTEISLEIYRWRLSPSPSPYDQPEETILLRTYRP